MVESLMSMEQLQAVSELLWGADWALAHGDLGTLREVALRLKPHVAQPLRLDLQTIAELSNQDPDEAVSRWMRTRETLHCFLCDRAEGVSLPT